MVREEIGREKATTICITYREIVERLVKEEWLNQT